jgi:hypothetical protein
MELSHLVFFRHEMRDLFRQITNKAECGAFSIFFSMYIIVFFWHMQLFRRVFRLRKEKSIVKPTELVTVHIFMAIFLICTNAP